MADDKLRAILQRKLGALAKPILSGFERKFKNIAKSPKIRDEIAVKLEAVNGKMEVMNSIREFAIDKCEKDAELHLPDDKLHKCLQPIVGTACSIVVVQKLEEFNPELKNNDELRDKFIQLLEQTPKEDKSHMVAAVIKISKIKELLASKGDDFEFADAYKNFENITTRLLKNFYTIAKYAETIIPSKTLTEEEKLTYLNKYFKFDLYRLFVDTIFLWNEEGGDILKMSRYLVEQVRLKEEYLLTCQSITKTKTIEFVVLWSIALVILMALRFALSQFFSYIAKTLIYQIAVVITLLFALFSIYLLLTRINSLNLEGWKDDEKK